MVVTITYPLNFYHPICMCDHLTIHPRFIQFLKNAHTKETLIKSQRLEIRKSFYHWCGSKKESTSAFKTIVNVEGTLTNILYDSKDLECIQCSFTSNVIEYWRKKTCNNGGQFRYLQHMFSMKIQGACHLKYVNQSCALNAWNQANKKMTSSFMH